MNYCVIQQNGGISREEMMSFVSVGDCKDSVLCPKPHRVVNPTCFNEPSRSLRCHRGRHQAEISDAKVGLELLDIILSKGGQGPEKPSSHIASSPPFFCGSPPSRVSNPLIHDARFREDKKHVPSFSPLPCMPIPATPGSGSSTNYSSRKGGCIRANFGNNPSVRIEGFDCLDRDRRNCSIPALA